MTKRLIALCAAVAAAVLPLSAVQAQERTIRAALVVSKEHSLGIGLSAMAQCVGQKSGGKLKLQPFFDGALGTDAATLQQMRTGTLDMLVTATSYMATVTPAVGVFDLPFLFANEKEADAVLDGQTGELVTQKLAGAGIVNLAYWENGFRNMTNSKRPITRMEDLQGLKMRSLPSPAMLATFKALGGFGVAMPFPELYSALETRTVDGQENPVNLVESAKFYEVQKYLSLTRHLYNPVAVMYSKRLWDQLATPEQAVVRDCARSATAEQRRVNRLQAERSLGRLKELGMAINSPSDSELARMREATTAVHDGQWPTIGVDVKTALASDLQRARAR